MVASKAVETISAFPRKANATPGAYHAREAVIVSRIANHGTLVSAARPSASPAIIADAAERSAPIRRHPTLEASERAEMLRLIPALRAFAVSLTGSTDAADDLVQETLVRAMARIETFEPGTNMGAWLFTILRNLVFSQSRQKRRDGAYRVACGQQSGKTHPEQHGKVELMQMRQALMRLPPEQREAIILVGASGLSYEEAAAVIHCAVGTVKSRVSRARERLVTFMDADAPDRFGPDRQELAVVA